MMNNEEEGASPLFSDPSFFIQNSKFIYMPELPEVQTIVDDLNKKVVGRRVKSAWFAPAFKISSAKFLGAEIIKTERRAKYIKIYFNNGLILLIHLRMTGRILLGDDSSDKYRRFSLDLDNNQSLFLSDARKFGTAKLGTADEVEKLKELSRLGPEPFTLSADDFVRIVGAKKKKIKQVLLDQEIMVGVGNIYSDEALWVAKIHPLTPANKIGVKKLKELFLAIKKVLRLGIKLRGTSMSDYRDISGREGGYYEKRLVYHRAGEKCKRCGSEIKRIKIGGRSAHFCAKCQIATSY